jgi:hypothetical protein
MTEVLASIPTDLIQHEIALRTLKILQCEESKDSNGITLQSSLKKSIFNTKIYPSDYPYINSTDRTKAWQNCYHS